MHKFTAAVIVGFLIMLRGDVFGEDTPASRLVVVNDLQDIQSVLPKGTRLLHEPAAIEKFLEALDRVPPDWAQLYGQHGDRHDERLFALNRERDRLRVGRPMLSQQITFLWEGVLSRNMPDQAGFLVAVGPEIISTKWGLVRFKPESLYAELVAVPAAGLRVSLQTRMARGETVKVVVGMTGQLVPNEALIYDFAHEEPGLGMIMPVVRVEQIDYLIPP